MREGYSASQILLQVNWPILHQKDTSLTHFFSASRFYYSPSNSNSPSEITVCPCFCRGGQSFV
jgi:hypothetical protein